MTSPHAARIARFEAADLYVVITEAFCGGRPPGQVLRDCLDAGVRLVQLREKNLDCRDYLERAREFRAITAEAGALLIIDDRLDIAIAAGADGVHLGQRDLPAADARALAPDLVIGVSTHNAGQAVQAQQDGASYVNIGPIFDTQTKQGHGGAVGPDLIGDVRPLLRIPFTCMGGIKRHNIGETLRRGARHVAVVTAVTQAPDPREAASELRALIAAAAPLPESRATERTPTRAPGSAPPGTG